MSALASITTLYLRSRQKRLLQVKYPLTPRRIMQGMRWLPLPIGTSQRQRHVGNVPVTIISNTRARQIDRVLFYIHGGGFTGGSPATHAAFAARLMQAGGFSEVWLPDYRLAPEHVFPAARDDVMTVWQTLRLHHDVAHIAVAGESAGGNLALGLCVQLRDSEQPLPKRLYLMSPWLDLGLSSPQLSAHFQHDAFCGHPEHARDWIRQQFTRHYLGERTASDPAVSPVFADQHGLPPIYVQAAGNEIFNGDSLLLARRCQEAGTACNLEIWTGLFHAFALFAPLLPEANSALRRAAYWLHHGRFSQRNPHGHLLARS